MQPKFKTCYKYNPSTGEYIGENRAYLDPKVEFRYVTPNNTVLIQPLPPKDGYAQLLNDDRTAWEYVEDNRGLTLYDTLNGRQAKLNKLGGIPDGFTADAPGSFPKFQKYNKGVWTYQNAFAADAIKIANELVKIERETKSVEPITYRGVTFKADLVSQQDIMSKCVAGMITPDMFPIDWSTKDSDGTPYVFEMSLDDINALHTAISDRRSELVEEATSQKIKFGSMSVKSIVDWIDEKRAEVN